MRAVTRPGLIGKRRLGGLVIPIAARWSGGWGTEFDQVGVDACRQASGRDCKLLGGGELGCPDNSSRTRLGGWFTGWYLFALDARTPRDSACAGTGYFANADLPLWKLGATIVRSTPMGRIAGPPQPKVKILPQAVLHGSTLQVASINCVTRCRIWTVVFAATVGVQRRQTLIGHASVSVPRGPLTPGTLTVYMHIDDSPALSGRSRYS